MNNFSNNLKYYREKASLTLKALAEQLGVGTTTVHDWETKRSEPNIEMLINIADLFGITVDELVRDIK